MDNEEKFFLDYIKKINNDIKDDIISVGNDFKDFLKGILFNADCVGFYEQNTKNAYFFFHVLNPTEFCSIIYNAWKLFHENDNINVKCYYWKLKIKNNNLKVYFRILSI